MPRYGQHFLINTHAAQRIVDSMDLSSKDGVLEIGPGKGALTRFLLEKAGHLTVVEIDAEMLQILRDKFSGRKNLFILDLDILKLNLDKLEPSPSAAWKIIGNLPYNLTSPILRQLSSWKNWEFAVVMVQKEVGDRICAKVGDPEYGALTVGMNLTCAPEKIFDLAESSFKPAPRVKSSVVRLIRRETPLTSDIEGTQRVIQAAFQQRRKTLLNSLSHGLNIPKEKISAVLQKLLIPQDLRLSDLP